MADQELDLTLDLDDDLDLSNILNTPSASKPTTASTAQPPKPNMVASKKPAVAPAKPNLSQQTADNNPLLSNKVVKPKTSGNAAQEAKAKADKDAQKLTANQRFIPSKIAFILSIIAIVCSLGSLVTSIINMIK